MINYFFKQPLSKFQGLDDVNKMNLWNALNELSFEPYYQLKSKFFEDIVPTIVQNLERWQWLEYKYEYTCDVEFEEFGEISEESTNFPDENCEWCGMPCRDHPSFVTCVRLKQSIKQEVERLNLFFLGNLLGSDSLSILEEAKAAGSSLVPFLGAGVSVPMGVPSWPDLLNKLKPELPRAIDQTGVELHQSFERAYKSGSVFEMLDVMHHAKKFREPNFIRSEITRYIEAIQRKKLQFVASNIGDIISLGSGLVVTTNYDTLIEEYYSQVLDREYKSTSWKVFEGFSDLMAKDTILHIHGSINYKPDMIVTRSDYDDLYHNQNNDKTHRQVQTLFASSTFIFIGFSLEDKYVVDELQDAINLNEGSSHHFLITLKSKGHLRYDSDFTDRILPIVINDEDLPDNLMNKIWHLGIHVCSELIQGNMFY